MYLKRLEIQGFKSFANKTVLEFEKGATAVVGPNGSGKSNVADAIRWVLGEQSLKQLRGKKSEDVIFAGSDKKSRMSFAEVTVTFDNRDKKIPLDYAEVSISRMMDRSGESEYRINGNRVRLLDVIDLILKSNIGTARHTVIGQGTIDQMILSGPGEIKNLIDEASGVKTYYIRRDKTLKRLEQTTQNLVRVRDLLSEIEPRLKSLRRQAKRMEERANIEQELKMYQAEFFGARFWQFEDLLLALHGKIGTLEESKKKLEHEIEKHRANLEKTEGDNKQEVQEYHRIQTEIKKLTDKKNKLTEDIAVIRGKLQAEKSSAGSGDSKALDLEKHNLENARESLNAEIAQTSRGLSDVEKDLEARRNFLADITVKLSSIQKNLEHPENVNFAELAKDVEDLDREFEVFYQNIEQAPDTGAIVAYAQEFKSSLGRFKEKTTAFAHNPFANFEQQKRELSDVLSQKDKLSEEVSAIELKKSKLVISLEYQQEELSKVEQRLMHVELDLQKFSAGGADDYFKKLIEQEKLLNKDALGVAEEVSKLEQQISQYHSKEQSRKQEVLDEERMYRNKTDELSKLKDQEGVLLIEKAKLDTQKENLLAEAKQALGHEGVQKMSQERITLQHSDLENKIARIKNQLDMIGGIDELTIQEYKETEQRYGYLSGQVADLEKAISDLRSVMEELDELIKKKFDESFNKINQQFENYFRILFNGGRAYLSVIRAKEEKKANEAEDLAAEEAADGAEEQEESAQKMTAEEKMLAKYEHGANDVVGIDIKATPPGKKLASISALSGGERSLTSIALLCALLYCFPSPFVMLDEVDAALDEANTIRFAQILGTLANSTQFITVTHNRETMRQAHTLYGVTMGDDSVSKVLSIKIELAQTYAK